MNRLLAILLLGGVACVFSASGSPTFADAVTNGFVNASALTEASGVAASRNNPGVLWTHNDSGHAAQVFALDIQGRLLATCDLPGNTDNEDIAIGPGPILNVHYLYVGDIGDNVAGRSSIKIYQVPEPAIYARQFTNPVTLSLASARTITLTYPDGPRDAEAMFVDPLTGDLFILSKESASRIYMAPKAQLDTNDNFTLTFVRTLAFNVPSAADISPSGNEIIIRRENVASLWTRSIGQSISDALGGIAVSIPVTGTANGEPNGEAIGFDANGSGYFTLSDDAINQPLRYFARTSNDGPGLPPRVLVDAGSSWKYLDNGSNRDTAWRIPGYNDSGWSNGVAQFGYGDGDEQTVVGYGPNVNNKYITTYFRAKFVVDNPGDLFNLKLKMVVDDGAAVFLNGTPLTYFHLSTNDAFNSVANPEQPTELENTWFTFSTDASLLVSGTNTLAVEVHQWSPVSSDISFDLQLLASGRGGAYEPFNYPVGTPLTLVTNSGGQSWSAAGSGSSMATVVNDPLSVPGLERSAGEAMHILATDGPSARFNLITNVTSGTIFFSFALKVTSLGALGNAGGSIAGFNNSRGTQGATPHVLTTRILARAAEVSSFNLGVAKDSTAPAEWVWATNVFTLNQTIFLVGSYTFGTNSSTDDLSQLWLNPSASQFGSNPPPAPELSAANGSDITGGQIASFVFLQAGANNTNQPGGLVIDELRIGPTWASVTPTLPPPPILSARRLVNGLALSWPLSAGAFVLESIPSLLPPAPWTPVNLPISIAGGQFTLTNGFAAGSSYFRLSR